MPEQLSINISKPIKSVNVIDYRQMSIESDSKHITSETILKQADSSNERFIPRQDFDNQKNILSQVCQTLQNMTEKLQIARLSVEIARKVLAQRVEKGDYEIETIIKEVLSKSPARHDIDIHLNPEDLTNLQKTLLLSMVI